MLSSRRLRSAFTLIELLVVIAIIAILTVVVILSLNPAELLRQSRDANRVSDMATIADALNVYSTDLAGNSSFNLGNASNTYPSTYDPSATSTSGDQCQGLGMLSLTTSTGQSWQCASSSTLRIVNNQGWIPVNFNSISSGSPIGNLPVDPTNQTSTGFFYAYNTNGTQFEVTANLESQKYKTQYGNAPQTSLFPEIISGGIPTISALYNPSGLIGYWPLNEGSGSSTIDQSGSGDNGTWSGTAIGTNNTYYTGGKVGTYAGDFNGTNDTISAGSSSILSPASFTISSWVYPESYVSGPSIISNAGSNGWGIIILASSGDLRLTNIGSAGSVTGGVLPLNTWSYVSATYSGGTGIVYINGSKSSSGAVTLNTPNGPFVVGASSLSGFVDDVRLYNRVLSPAEIMALYNAEH
jgi:prepilin-type N-terminal cleavage/methylation domain-containing protein